MNFEAMNVAMVYNFKFLKGILEINVHYEIASSIIVEI